MTERLCHREKGRQKEERGSWGVGELQRETREEKSFIFCRCFKRSGKHLEVHSSVTFQQINLLSKTEVS